MSERTVEFDLSNDDTCMKHWSFTLDESAVETIIRSVKIKPSGEGCVGHPKTIMALMRDTPIRSLDLDALIKTKCVRTNSCGMNLASCVREIIRNGQ